ESILAGIGLVLFVWHELRTSNPIVNLRILKNRQLAAGVTFASVLGFALYASVFALPVFLQNLLGYAAWDTGRVILPGAIAIAITATLLTRFTEQGRQALVPHLSLAEPSTRVWLEQVSRRMLSAGGTLAEAQNRAYGALEGVLRQQASMVAFEKVFLTMGITFT